MRQSIFSSGTDKGMVCCCFFCPTPVLQVIRVYFYFVCVLCLREHNDRWIISLSGKHLIFSDKSFTLVFGASFLNRLGCLKCHRVANTSARWSHHTSKAIQTTHKACEGKRNNNTTKTSDRCHCDEMITAKLQVNTRLSEKHWLHPSLGVINGKNRLPHWAALSLHSAC